MTCLLPLLISSLFLLPKIHHARASFSSCSLSNYTAGSPFQSNLNQLLSILPRNAGFDNASFGTGKTRVYGLAICFADVNATACNDCLAKAPSDIIKTCPISTAADIMYDSCALRYSDHDFSHAELITMLACVPHDTDITPDKLTDPKEFKIILQQLMHDLAVNASVSSLKLATSVVEYMSTRTIYGLVQCARELEPAQCEKCINEAFAFVGNCNDETVRGAGVTTPSCYLRYEFHPFYVISEAKAPWKSNGGGGKKGMFRKILFIILVSLCTSMLL